MRHETGLNSWRRNVKRGRGRGRNYVDNKESVQIGLSSVPLARSFHPTNNFNPSNMDLVIPATSRTKTVQNEILKSARRYGSAISRAARNKLENEANQIQNRYSQGKGLASIPQKSTKDKIVSGTKASQISMYCLFYNRFGRCRFGEKCSLKHEPSKVMICPSFLKGGGCIDKKCTLSHVNDPERAPTCFHFLQDRCSRPNCPYRHVKVPVNAEQCPDFIAGFCPRGLTCRLMHSQSTGFKSSNKYSPPTSFSNSNQLSPPLGTNTTATAQPIPAVAAEAGPGTGVAVPRRESGKEWEDLQEGGGVSGGDTALDLEVTAVEGDASLDDDFIPMSMSWEPPDSPEGEIHGEEGREAVSLGEGGDGDEYLLETNATSKPIDEVPTGADDTSEAIIPSGDIEYIIDGYSGEVAREGLSRRERPRQLRYVPEFLVERWHTHYLENYSRFV